MVGYQDNNRSSLKKIHETADCNLMQPAKKDMYLLQRNLLNSIFTTTSIHYNKFRADFFFSDTIGELISFNLAVSLFCCWTGILFLTDIGSGYGLLRL